MTYNIIFLMCDALWLITSSGAYILAWRQLAKIRWT